MLARGLVACAAVVAAASANAFIYQWDDGSEETSLSTSGPATFDPLFLNHFTVQPGAQTINAIQIIWGSVGSPNLPNNLAADVLFMDDPNGDGNPNDATVVQSIATMTTGVGTNVFNTYAITPVTMSVGTSFFVGGHIHGAPNGSSWLGLDTQSVGNAIHGWWNPNTPTATGSHLPLNIFGNDLAIFARAVSIVPEPATMVALGLGAAALIRRRRRA